MSQTSKKDVKPKVFLPVVSVLVILSTIVKDTQAMINWAKIRRYSARLSRIIVLLFNKLIKKQPKSQIVTFLNLSVDIFSLHFFFPRTKLRIPPGICYLRMTDIESIMTIFG